METYPSLKPLPTPEKAKIKKVTQKGQVSIADYNQKAFREQFKKEK